METLIIILLLVLIAEVTYLATESRRKNRKTNQAPIFIDTSVLIDGRIVAVAESGFISRPLYIPRSVVGELQFLADNGDSEKRSRARHGLDVINKLQSVAAVNVVIFADGVRAEEGVDNRLLELATEHKGALCTIDYNLNKVAVVQGIQVLNVNELAKTLRMAYLPGEKLKIELAQKGNESHQAVGHLPDGTMVVVEHAHKLIGSVVEVEFIRALQTAAGKMMFAKVVGSVAGSKSQVRKAQRTSTADGASSKKQDVSKKPRGTKPAIPAEDPKKDTRRAKRGAAPSDNASTQSTPKAPKAPVQKQQGVRQASRPQRQRRKSPEDSLVELANNQ